MLDCELEQTEKLAGLHTTQYNLMQFHILFYFSASCKFPVSRITVKTAFLKEILTIWF